MATSKRDNNFQRIQEFKERFDPIPFAKLRQNYIVVKQFLEDASACDVKLLSNRITNDLGVDGDDAEELLIKFVKQYDLKWGDFEFDKHFYSEGEIYGPWPALHNIVILIIKVLAWIIKILSFKHFNFSILDWYRPTDREVSDLTFKQMLIWYIEKDFKEASQSLYKPSCKSSLLKYRATLEKMKPKLNETAIVCNWIFAKGEMTCDHNCERIQWLVDNYLVKVSTIDGGWTTNYKDPEDGRYWQRTYPYSEMQGGGPATLKL
jgi:hypothetical protein